MSLIGEPLLHFRSTAVPCEVFGRSVAEQSMFLRFQNGPAQIRSLCVGVLCRRTDFLSEGHQFTQLGVWLCGFVRKWGTGGRFTCPWIFQSGMKILTTKMKIRQPKTSTLAQPKHENMSGVLVS